MVGNGNFAFTADITGLQSFPEQYSKWAPLLTEAQWGWHSFPNPSHFKYEDSLVPVDVHGTTQYYPWLHDWSEAKKPAIAWLRENPHRISLGRIALYLTSKSGQTVRFSDLASTQQTLDLWSGSLLSQFEVAGEAVQVETSVHPDLDMLMVTLRGPALAAGRLGVELRFPGVAASLNPDPADWQHPERHQTTVTARDARSLSLTRTLDDTRYFVTLNADQNVTSSLVAPHTFRVLPQRRVRPDSMTILVLFSSRPPEGKTPPPQRTPRAGQTKPQPSGGDSHARQTVLPSPAATRSAVAEYWSHYWSKGGAIDLSGSTDPRAPELERRIVLSQYLMAVNAAGSLPPQEEGLFSNSWNGKFHLEMHAWHAAHFAVWGHPELLERSMPWYLEHLEEAEDRARAHGLQGAWWPKMVGPEGRESPSTITPFIMWQQPTPIYLAELTYRAKPTRTTLARYRDLVFDTANLLASFAYFDRARGEYVLGPPIVPAQEVFPPLSTFNPAFELEYFRFGLATAQKWRQRLSLPRDAHWDEVLQKLAPLPQRDGLYLATESFPQLWEQARSPACSAGHAAPQCWNRDHPAFLGALGLLPGEDVDHEIMRKTLHEVETHWDLRQTWGWDFPLLAMTATRLHQPEKAIELLLYDAPNNHFGRAGMTPRVHLEATQVGAPPSYHRDAETYFPANGSLLLAVALMSAGWDGETTPSPGFPKDGRWRVRVEGIQPLP
jgi:hypothetical protein